MWAIRGPEVGPLLSLPKKALEIEVERTGIEPVTSGLQRRSGFGQRRSDHGTYRVTPRCSGTVKLRGSGVPDKTPDNVARTGRIRTSVRSHTSVSCGVADYVSYSRRSAVFLKSLKRETDEAIASGEQALCLQRLLACLLLATQPERGGVVFHREAPEGERAEQ